MIRLDKNNPNTQVFAKNNGDQTFVGKYARVTYTIPPGAQKVIPFVAACLWFGDPYAVDIDKKRQNRHREYERLRVKYGIYEHENLLHLLPTHIDIFDVETGEQITTLAQDPEGHSLGGAIGTETGERNTQQAISRLEAELAALKASQAGPLDDEAQVDPDLVDAAPEAKPAKKAKRTTAGAKKTNDGVDVDMPPDAA